MKKSTYMRTSIVCFFIFIVFISCKTVPTEVSFDVTEPELLQMAQSAIDDNNPEAARFYFETMITRFGMNHASLVVAEFELAHLDVKEGKNYTAQAALERILSYYEDPQLAMLLPPEYKKLAQIDLEKIVGTEE